MKVLDATELRKLYENKTTVVDIAEHFGVCASTIQRNLKTLGLSRERLSLVEDITGQVFGRLTALRFERLDRFGKAVWLTRCECGKEKVINTSAMKAGLTTSCGCCKREKARKGVGELSQAYWRKLEKAATQRGLLFQMTKQDAWDLFLQQGQKCALSGIEITLFANWDKYRLQTASLDRIDSTKGYVPGNVQWVHKRVNFLKRDYSEAELIYWCCKVAGHSGQRYEDITRAIPSERRPLHEGTTVVQTT
jgi:hypothetical protein